MKGVWNTQLVELLHQENVQIFQNLHRYSRLIVVNSSVRKFYQMSKSLSIYSRYSRYSTTSCKSNRVPETL